MHIYVRRGGPNYQTGLAKMRKLGAELGVRLSTDLVSPTAPLFAMQDLLYLKFINANGQTYQFVVGGSESLS